MGLGYWSPNGSELEEVSEASYYFFFLSLTKEAGSSVYVLEVFHCELRIK